MTMNQLGNFRQNVFFVIFKEKKLANQCLLQTSTTQLKTNVGSPQVTVLFLCLLLKSLNQATRSLKSKVFHQVKLAGYKIALAP